MTDRSPDVELRLLTYRPEEMAAWWSALIGGAPRSLNARATAVTGAGLGVVIERSQIALDYHPEASGVIAIHVAPGDIEAVRQSVNRLAQISSHPYRASRESGATALWFHDPNGTDVALNLPPDLPPAVGNPPVADGSPEEIDPAEVLTYISTTHDPEEPAQ